jgi:outer membrane protein assembly factor BamB
LLLLLVTQTSAAARPHPTVASDAVRPGRQVRLTGVWRDGPASTAPSEWHEDRILALGPSRDGARLTSIAANGSVVVWNARVGSIEGRRGGNRIPIVAANFSSDGAFAVIALERVREWLDADRPGILLIDGRTARTLGGLAFDYGTAELVALAPGGHAAAVADTNQLSTFSFRAPGGRHRGTDPVELGGVGPLRALSMFKGGDLLVATGSQECIPHHDLSQRDGVVARVNADRRVRWGFSAGVMRNVVATPDGRSVFGASSEGAVVSLDPGTGRQRWRAEAGDVPLTCAFKPAILALAASPDGKRVVAAHGSGGLLFWDAEGTPIDEVSMPPVTALAFSSDGRTLYAGDQSGAIHRFEF